MQSDCFSEFELWRDDGDCMSLPGIVYSNFCSDGKLIYAFNSSENQIEVYEM